MAHELAVDGAWQALSSAYPWPGSRPDVPEDEHGWLDDGVAELLAERLADASSVLELGSWLGLSARFMLTRSRDLRLVCVDWWQGDDAIRGREKHARRIATSHQTFLRNCWDFRDRLIAVKESTEDGIRIVNDAGYVPDLVYVDACHEYADVKRDLIQSLACFPHAQFVGDDYVPAFSGVMRAVDEVAAGHGFHVRSNGRGWTFQR